MGSIQEIWEKYRQGKANSEEKKKLIKAIDDEDNELHNLLRANWKNARTGKIGDTEKKEVWNHLSQSIQLRPRKTISMYRYGLAAGLAVLMALSILFYTTSHAKIQVQVASGERIKEVVLPDGSKVWINHASSISYPKKFGSESRNLHLEGHAFFEIERNPDRPFLVETEGLTIKVLGTSFDVYNFKDESSTVSVKSGKVEVSHPGSDSRLVLGENERSVYDFTRGRLVKTTFDSASIMAWRNNTLHFENLELGLALKQIERKYGVRILCSDPQLLAIRIRARYTAEPLDTVLTDLAFMTNFNFDKNETNNEITLKPTDMSGN